MADATKCLSDAAKAVVDRTVSRLQNALTPEQFAGLRQLAARGQFFDVEALAGLADLSAQSNEAGHGN